MLQMTVIGNLGRDAELQQINGHDYIKFSAAHQDRQDAPTVWVSVLFYTSNGGGKLLPLLRKGAKVYAQGRCSLEVYKDKPQATIWADNVQICSLAPDEGKHPQSAQDKYEDGEDLPF